MKINHALYEMIHHIQELLLIFFIWGLVYVNQGDFEELLSTDRESLQTKRAIHGRDKAHPEIAASLSNIALVYKDQAKPIEAIQFYEESFAMQQVIHGPNTSHPSIAILANFARAYHEFGELQKAVLMHEQSLNMERAIYGTAAAHPEIVYSFHDSTNVHAQVGSVQEASHYRGKVLKCRESSVTARRRQRNVTLPRTRMK